MSAWYRRFETEGIAAATRVVVATLCVHDYGMELITVRIERVDYVASVWQTVYQVMISERLRIARLYNSEAKEEENRILGATQNERDPIEGEMEQETR